MIKDIDLVVKRRSADSPDVPSRQINFSPSTHCGIKEIINGEVGGLAGRALPADQILPTTRSGGGLTSGAASCSIRRDLEQASQPGSKHNLTTQTTQYPTLFVGWALRSSVFPRAKLKYDNSYPIRNVRKVRKIV